MLMRDLFALTFLYRVNVKDINSSASASISCFISHLHLVFYAYCGNVHG